MSFYLVLSICKLPCGYQCIQQTLLKLELSLRPIPLEVTFSCLWADMNCALLWCTSRISDCSAAHRTKQISACLPEHPK